MPPETRRDRPQPAVDPLAVALRHAAQTSTSPRVRAWLYALLGGERASGPVRQQAEGRQEVRT